ncbi:MAG: Uma2 family endonuclease [Candidatus Magnetobacterium sp. LHC-1]|uniref:Uma2 family endonuclease n=1 Tax=Candidatus Magnetobacterium casense TaxID=1455061 RepID=A0ABS6S0L7_9BACT|nr:Uma2 family endonuclease [Candidatus Magnetobacterium casensis]MBF0606969.1 Uma2 family endonuclease [Nitrospirota bacterium]MBV6342407.1 Uma2 family endonuclease [Candidatus Magnetobacterium casensis]
MQTLESEDLRTFDLTQIINGEEFVSPSPLSKHQGIVFKLSTIINTYIRNKKIGKVFISPLDVILEDGLNRLQPDLIFIHKNNKHILQDWIRGVPDMVCEVVSKNTLHMDTDKKKKIYQRYRVPEYWLVYPEYGTLEIYTIKDGEYELYSSAIDEGVVRSKAIEGLEVGVSEIFEEDTWD